MAVREGFAQWYERLDLSFSRHFVVPDFGHGNGNL
jgi:hypothetical protein